MSVSFGLLGYQYINDPVAIGSFHAIRKGMLTIASVGNLGQSRAVISNGAPWLLTVGASTMDRKFVSKLVLGQIVLCERRSTGYGVLVGDGAGFIIPVLTFDEPAVPFSFPATENIDIVLGYIRSSEKPVATILVTKAWKDHLAPNVAPFSPRGPNLLAPDILKPDLVAAGAEILAAWSPIASPSIEPTDTRRTNCFINSGTSMSCPHVTGVAANTKVINQKCSAAAIKSALMTTSYEMDPKKLENEEFAYGSGLLNPSMAVNPGLVFNASDEDYVNFLSKQGYNTTTVRLITGDRSVCKSNKPGRGWDLNYPSFSLPVKYGHEILGKFTRTVTNVSSSNATYHVSVNTPDSINVTVKP
ncbi:hypothetical protein FNV43_RR24161 [Rhamnella rubrinervis]|uniref:Uncharacterized protein n=1 Tax=Rhamnella rubrinervis TaxID=2594499 RepID=A0A8K0GNU8_9ROSA|nr:hypothetical protein FNV43_RR24161 [Rhamnella rubrinervis]